MEQQVEKLSRRIKELTTGIQEQYKKISMAFIQIQAQPPGGFPDIIYDELRYQDKNPLVLLKLSEEVITHLLKYLLRLNLAQDYSRKDYHGQLTPENAREKYIEFIQIKDKRIRQLEADNQYLKFQLAVYCQKLKASQESTTLVIQSAEKTISLLKEELSVVLDTLKRRQSEQQKTKEQLRKIDLENQDYRIKNEKDKEDKERAKSIKRSWINQKRVLKNQWKLEIDQLEKKYESVFKEMKKKAP